jgi:hypothetical protein
MRLDLSSRDNTGYALIQSYIKGIELSTARINNQDHNVPLTYQVQNDYKFYVRAENELESFLRIAGGTLRIAKAISRRARSKYLLRKNTSARAEYVRAGAAQMYTGLHSGLNLSLKRKSPA